MISSGVPQRSIVGPILFNEVFNKVTMHFYLQKLCREATCGKKRLNGFFFFPYIASLHTFADKNTLSLNQCMGLQKFLNQEAKVILISLMKIKSLIIMKNLGNSVRKM